MRTTATCASWDWIHGGSITTEKLIAFERSRFLRVYCRLIFAGVDDDERQGTAYLLADELLAIDELYHDWTPNAQLFGPRWWRTIPGLTTSYRLQRERASQVDLPYAMARMLNVQLRAIFWKTELALVRYRLDHGVLPPSLQALSPRYLAELPLDPWTGRPLEYSSSGEQRWINANGTRIPPQTPFLWSRGPWRAELERSSQWVDAEEYESWLGHLPTGDVPFRPTGVDEVRYRVPTLEPVGQANGDWRLSYYFAQRMQPFVVIK